MDEKEVKGIKIWKIIRILLIILTLTIYFYIKNKPKEEIKHVINKNYNSKTISNITFENIKIYEKENKYFFTAKAINKTKKDIKLKRIEIRLDNNIFYSYIGDNIKSKSYKMIFMETNKDISNIKNIEFIL